MGYSCLILHCQSLDKIGFLAHHDFEDTFCELQSFSSSFLRVNIYSSVVEDNLDRRLLGQKLVSLCLSFFSPMDPYSQKRECFPSSKCYGITDTHVHLFLRVLLSVIWMLAFIRPQKTEQSHEVHLGLLFMVS